MELERVLANPPFRHWTVLVSRSVHPTLQVTTDMQRAKKLKLSPEQAVEACVVVRY
jgi:hypothetical protein